MNSLLSTACVALAGAFFGGVALKAYEGRPAPERLPDVLTNQGFIDGLYSDLDLEDVDAVFGHIFRSLDSKVVVYPSEGYYYFKFPARGVTVKGTILLSAGERDDGVLGFGYVGEMEDAPHGEHLRAEGRHYDYGPGDGLVLERLDAFHYAATFEGRTVEFELFDPGHAPPETLGPTEEYVGTTMDESGLSFDLLFDTERSKLLWVLNESRFVPDSMLAVGEHLLQGARTKFVFFRDRELGRRLLIGVHAGQVRYNSWYDGPFDQLPDTRVGLGEIDMRAYLCAHTGIEAEKLNRYGIILERPGARIPAAPYGLYEDLSEFDFVSELVSSNTPRSELIAAMTKERRPDSLR